MKHGEIRHLFKMDALNFRGRIFDGLLGKDPEADGVIFGIWNKRNFIFQFIDDTTRIPPFTFT